MKTIRSIKEMKDTIHQLKRSGQSIGFVPTMGYLHEGHGALIDHAHKDADIVIVSIFVNPLQFGENEDFDNYPRNEQKDKTFVENKQVDYLFIPTADQMYPTSMGLTMVAEKRIGVLCDRSRPGHFGGVLTVLTKLFHIIEPNYVFFGSKDAQQVAIVDLLIKDFNFPISLKMVATVRDSDGLAKSSRNTNLLDHEREEAPQLHQALQLARNKIIDGEKNPVNIVNEVKDHITKKTSGQIDYVEILSFPELEIVSEWDRTIIIALAVQFSHARLIDNIIIDNRGEPVDSLY
ncbi:pantoate--beta-alanine ligase [Amphibacillus cookii]|uniref:pantoate--beta-alanine ligase n=1 Tax=Amphibacillus cookii TaxID=767787 RepID=UPI0019586D14|nr:pantoate--beta-alanine ligase [Amphibacillus cookii]